MEVEMKPRRWLTCSSALALMAGLSLAQGAPSASAAAPSNDNLGNAIAINGASGSSTGSNLDATVQAGESGAEGHVAQATAWWDWTAPSDGSYMFDTCGSNFSAGVGVFTGNAVDSLADVASSATASCAYDGNYLYQDELVFSATSGTVYHIQVGSRFIDGSVGAMGDITLRWWPSIAPGNDSFASATQLTGTSGTTSGTNRFATAEPTDPDYFGGAGTVWWKWTPPSDGTYVFDTCGSNFDSKMGLYTGDSLSNLTAIAENDDSCTYQAGLPSFDALTTETYFIAVGAFDAYQVGDITLNWQSGTPPANDNFAEASPISGTSGSVSGNTRFATNENEVSFYGDTTIWWLWTAPASGSVVFDTCGSDAYTRLGAFTGTDVYFLTELTQAAQPVDAHLRGHRRGPVLHPRRR
jgi:hypothetical protein